MVPSVPLPETRAEDHVIQEFATLLLMFAILLEILYLAYSKLKPRFSSKPFKKVRNFLHLHVHILSAVLDFTKTRHWIYLTSSSIFWRFDRNLFTKVYLEIPSKQTMFPKNAF